MSEREDVNRRVGIKWGRYDDDILPAWIADMDFEPAPPVVDAVRAYVDGGDWGYVDPVEHERLIEAGRRWEMVRHGWEPNSTNTRVVLDVMQGVAAAIAAFTEPGDGVISTTPVYHPFGWAIDTAGRTVCEAPLTDRDDGYRVTREALEAAVERGGKLLLLCNPHNPTGRVLSAEELSAVAAVAVENDLIVVSDEIHADLVYEPHRHIPLAVMGDAIAERTVTVFSPSKAFNLAGVGCALMTFGHEDLAARFDELPFALMSHATGTGLRAARAAWEHGDEWLADLRDRLATNRDHVTAWVSEDRQIGYRVPEATYLAWLDFRPHGWSNEPSGRLIERAKVALSPGDQFGTQGRGHARLNFGTQPEMLAEILDRMARGMSPTNLVL